MSLLKPVVLRYAEVCGYFHQATLLLKVKDYKDTTALTAVIQMLQHQSVTAMLDAKQVVSRMAQIKIYTHVNVHMYPKMDHYYFWKDSPPLHHTSILPACLGLSTLSYPAELGGESWVYIIRQGELSGLRLISGQIKKIIPESCFRVSYPTSKIYFLLLYSKYS